MYPGLPTGFGAKPITTIALPFNNTQRNNNSQGLMPVCFLKAVEKCEMEE